MKAWMVWGVVGIAGIAAACAHRQGALSPTGYVPEEGGYEVRFADGHQRSLMSPDWQLDNFVGGGGEGFKPKEGSDYQAELFFDANDDGKSDNLGSYPIYDLRFVHRRTAGVIWIRSIPLESTVKDKELRVLADRIVGSISGGGHVIVQLQGLDYATNKDQRYAANVQHRTEATLAGKPAHSITVDVSNVDRLKVEPDSVEARVTVVLVRTGAKRAYDRTRQEFPLLLVVSYANSVEDYPATERDFVSLLSRITVEGRAGFRLHQYPPSNVPREEPSPAQPKPDDGREAPEQEGPSGTPDGGTPLD
jgi:hypothetical protein